MIRKSILIIFLFCSIVFNANAQSNAHPTVDSLEVNYKFSTKPPVENSSSGIQVLPEAKITLKNTENISKVYLKIRNTTSNEIVYEVSYTLSSSSIINEQGDVLYTRQGNKIMINVPDQIMLQPYICEVITEDNQNILSEVYSKIQ